jgi:hypothetical protein
MAGDGIRFGGEQFKPFIDGTEKLFIELAAESFDPLVASGHTLAYHFIYRADQELRFQVRRRLETLFAGKELHFRIIDGKTSGPVETVIRGGAPAGPAFVCDCDHYVNVEPMIAHMDTADIIIPTATIAENEFASWGKVKLTPNGAPISFHEKEFIPFNAEYVVRGLLGCYYFRDLAAAMDGLGTYANFSDCLPLFNKKGLHLQFAAITDRGSFGTPDDLIRYRYQLARKRTYFIDIDGTLLHLPKHVSYDPLDTSLLPGAKERIDKWRAAGHIIVLTTGRVSERRDRLVNVLAHHGIAYDQLVTGLRPGPRILINDKKPYSPFHRMAVGVQLHRNEGIVAVDVPETPEIVKTLKGGSFATVFLVRQIDGRLVVRKYIEKRPETAIHYETLRRQLDELRRFDFYSPGLVPHVLSTFESEDEFYFDMEYLDTYQELAHLSSFQIETTLPAVIQRLKDDIYCYSKEVDGRAWLHQFLKEKIFSKFAYLESLGPQFAHMLNAHTLRINSLEVKGLASYFESLDFSLFDRLTLSPVHGDLTLENILLDTMTGDWKLIDQSGARFTELREFDAAKLLQSCLAKYETWDQRSDLASGSDNDFDIPADLLILNVDKYKFLAGFGPLEVIWPRALFFLACYFVRMIPFLIKKSERHAVCGLALALRLFNEAT